MTTNPQRTEELEIRRKSQELAVAWRNGQAAFVLDSLEAEDLLRAALIASLVYDALARWDPYDSRWPNGFRHALLLRSQGSVTPDELAELEREYGRRFGAPPPLPAQMASQNAKDSPSTASVQAKRIRAALASGRPLVRERPASDSAMFLRPRRRRRREGRAPLISTARSHA